MKIKNYFWLFCSLVGLLAIYGIVQSNHLWLMLVFAILILQGFYHSLQGQGRLLLVKGLVLILLIWLAAYELFAMVEQNIAQGKVGLGHLSYVLLALFLFSWGAMIWIGEGMGTSAFKNSWVKYFHRLSDFLPPILFGMGLVFLWELLTLAYQIPKVLLPPPSAIYESFIGSLDILWEDFQQTVLKGALVGFLIGNLAGFVMAILADRVPFLKQGLMPLGNFVSALPIIGIAPIMVMWFGFDWQSKAAVVVIMTFFPMLVNTVSGLASTGKIEQELMATYASSYWSNLMKLRLPYSMPFIFNGLKLNATLALIGSIVAEFFGTPIVGIGFRISTEVGRMNVGMVWAEIVVAALVGTGLYGILSLWEKRVTFWHPSVRRSGKN